MEKVKLTQEQAGEIERIKNYFNRHEYITKFVETNGVSDSEFHIEELVRALYTGYEVEPEFKAGDWVHNNLNGCVFQIKEYQLEVINDDPRNIRHATKQEAWWASHGRDVDQYKHNDVIKESYNQVIREVSHVEDNIVYMKCGGGFGKDALKIVCFAEDRKDLGDD